MASWCFFSSLQSFLGLLLLLLVVFLVVVFISSIHVRFDKNMWLCSRKTNKEKKIVYVHIGSMDAWMDGWRKHVKKEKERIFFYLVIGIWVVQIKRHGIQFIAINLWHEQTKYTFCYEIGQKRREKKQQMQMDTFEREKDSRKEKKIKYIYQINWKKKKKSNLKANLKL